jgi:hypothetical protein
MTLAFSRVTLPPLWTVEEAKVHLHLTGTAYDADVQQKLDASQEAILSYLAAGGDPTWTSVTAPLPVKNAILLLLGNFYEHRGDGTPPDPWPQIYSLLAAYRDPTIA